MPVCGRFFPSKKLETARLIIMDSCYSKLFRRLKNTLINLKKRYLHYLILQNLLIHFRFFIGLRRLFLSPKHVYFHRISNTKLLFLQLIEVCLLQSTPFIVDRLSDVALMLESLQVVRRLADFLPPGAQFVFKLFFLHQLLLSHLLKPMILLVCQGALFILLGLLAFFYRLVSGFLLFVKSFHRPFCFLHINTMDYIQPLIHAFALK